MVVEIFLGMLLATLKTLLYRSQIKGLPAEQATEEVEVVFIAEVVNNTSYYFYILLEQNRCYYV